MTSRAWVFTINNPTPEDHPKTWNLEKVKLLAFQLEKGENGTLHWQGYIQLTQAVRLTGVKRTYNGRAHWERRRGTHQQAILYATKEDTRDAADNMYVFAEQEWKDDPMSYVRFACGSERSSGPSVADKLEGIRKQIVEALAPGSTTRPQDVLDQIAEQHFDLWVKYYRAFEKYVCTIAKPRQHETEVIVLQGPTGTGKSRFAAERYPGAYWKQRSGWWDQYFGQETVVLDEFYGWLPYDLLLRMCDRYPLLVETKGGQAQFTAKTIVITTNSSPRHWYKNAYFPAFARRVSKWIIMPELGVVNEYNTWEEVKDNFVVTMIDHDNNEWVHP